TELASGLKARIAPAVIVEKGGEKIGILGATTQILESISSPSGTEVKGFPGGPGANGEIDDMALLASQLQPIIDSMIADGINKIILTTHLQDIANEKLLATLLRGVDVILSAGSNTRLGDADDAAHAFPGHGASFDDTYPLVIDDAAGGKTLIVNTDNEYTYLGRLKVDFDAAGNILVDHLAADSGLNGAYASTAENAAAAWNTTVDNLDSTAFAQGTKGAAVRALTEAVGDVIAVKDGNVFGYTNVYLEAERSLVRSEETNLGNLSADANGHALRQALGDGAPPIISLKNGGGIRAQIGTVSDSTEKLPPPANPDAGKLEGGVSQLDIENSLRFDNKLMAFDTTAEGLKAILEHGVAAGTLQGRFPQIGGVAFSWDPDAPAGHRISDIALIDEQGHVTYALYDDGQLQSGVPPVMTVITLNFTANGGDGYPVKDNASNFRYLLDDNTLSGPVDEALDFTLATTINAHTPAGRALLGEQQAFADYMRDVHGTKETAYDVADTSAQFDERIQNLNFRHDSVLANTHDDDGNAAFDSTLYLQHNQDVRDSGMDPLEHYNLFGWHEGRDPNPFFDTSGYLTANPDVAAAGVNPFQHYLQYGAAEGRDTALNFDSGLYLHFNPDVAAAGINALEHYLSFGRAEGRDTYTAVGHVAGDGFDAEYYLLANPDVAASGIDARAHYNAFGAAEGRSANALFDTGFYLAANPDVAASGINPLLHYQVFGAAEGRDPSAAFDTSAYLEANPDVAASGMNPLVHYLTYGIYEGRAIADQDALIA
ncbi:MAG TPA: 5'-nucleotidase C-terminal domain-containing protein, partial [Roseomonas sp.]